MPTTLLSSLIGLIGRSADSKDAWNTNQYNKLFAQREAEKNREFQREERLASQEFNLDMWNRNNEYNSPANQLKLLKAAGINPNSLSGNSFVASSPVETSPMSGTPTAMPSDASAGFLGRTPAMFGSIGNIVNSLSAARKAESEAELNQYNLDWNKMTESERLKQLKTNIKYQESQINGVLAKAHMDKMSSKEIEERTEWIGKLNDAEFKLKMQNLTNLYNENVALLKRVENESKLADQNIKESDSRIALNEKEGNLIDAQTSTEISRKGYVDAQTKSEETDALLGILEAKFANEMGMPVGSSDEQFYWKLWKTGELPAFIDEVRVPMEQSTWKPDDWSVRNAIPGSYSRARGYNYRTGYMNPRTYWPNLVQAFKFTGEKYY